MRARTRAHAAKCDAARVLSVGVHVHFLPREQALHEHQQKSRDDERHTVPELDAVRLAVHRSKLENSRGLELRDGSANRGILILDLDLLYSI